MIAKYTAFWAVGLPAWGALWKVFRDTRSDMLFGTPKKRFGALLARSSALYSRSMGGTNVVLFAWARSYWRSAIEEAKDLENLNPNQYQTLANIAVAGTPLLGKLFLPLGPLREEAEKLALEGLRRWKVEEEPLHTGALLQLDLAEAMFGSKERLSASAIALSEAREIAEAMNKRLKQPRWDDMMARQLVRIWKRIGALEHRFGRPNEARSFLRRATSLALDCSRDQVWKIRLLQFRLKLGL